MKDTSTYHQLKSLTHVSHIFNSKLDFDSIFDSILDETISVIEAAKGGSLWIFDESQNRLVAKSGQGLFYPHIFKDIKLISGESMTGMTFAAKKCLSFWNDSEIKQALSILTPYNKDILNRSISSDFHFTSVISSPILQNGKCIGVISLDSFENSLQFKEEDIYLLEAICHQAAIALEKSNLFQKKEKAVQKLSHSIQIHKNLVNLVVNGNGIQSIMDFTHKTIGKSLFLYDELGELMASACDSTFPMKMTETINQHAKQMILSLQNSRTVSNISLNGDTYQLIAFSLGSKLKTVGGIIILSQQKMSDVDLALLEHVCTIFSLELVKEQAVIETQQRLRGEFITKLFTGRIDETLIQKAKNLNLDPHRNYVVTIIDFEKKLSKKGMVGDHVTKNLIHIANMTLLKGNPLGMTIRSEHQIVALLSYSKVPSSKTIAEIKKHAKIFQQQIKNKYNEIDVVIGIGRMKEGLTFVHESFKEATKCIKFFKNFSSDLKVLSFTDLGVQRFILQHSKEDLHDFIQEVLGSLIEYDQARKSQFLNTLIIYLEQNQNIKKTSEALNIHINTLNYRLKRIEEILFADLSDSQQLFNIQLAINIYHYIKDRDINK